MKKIIILFPLILIPVSCYAQPHNLNHYDFYVIPTNYTNEHAIQKSIEFWEQYGFNLQETDHKTKINIEFTDSCWNNGYGNILGEYTKNDNAFIVISTSCFNSKLPENTVTKITEHELGHALGFAHYSISIMNPRLDIK